MPMDGACSMMACHLMSPRYFQTHLNTSHALKATANQKVTGLSSACLSAQVCPVVQVAYILATIIALDYLHDSWFYWTHRWLHSRLLYKHIHAIHHR